MRTIKRVLGELAVASAVLLSFTACGGGGGGGGSPGGPVESASVRGHVADAQTGEALAGVAVQVGALTATSDASGNYALAGAAAGANVVVRFSKPGFAVNFATVDVSGGRARIADRRLARVAVRKDLSADAGGTVTLDGSAAQVQLPAAGLVNAASGAAASGTVSVEMTPIDPGISPLNMPGNYRAQGEAVPIESMGALQVEIRDAGGALLNLASGKVATIRIPVPAGAKSPPLTMPLYYFKESTGLWVREGAAALAGTAPHQYYQGQVSHFTVWNADLPLDTIYINGCVVDAAGKPADATVTASGVDYFGEASVDTTMPGGQFKVPARRNSRVLVRAESGDDSDSVEVVTGTGDLTLSACLGLAKKPPVILTQPAGLSITQGAYDYLEVLAAGAGQYQWYRDGKPLAAGSRYLPVNGDASFAGDYYVVVSNLFGSVTSQTVKVTIVASVPGPVMVSQPVDVSVRDGASAQFAVQAQGDSLSYQWLRDGVGIAGANGAVLTLGAVTLADSGARFSCLVSNNGGSVFSNTALLTVSGEVVAPAIAQHPANVSVTVGQRATFAVVASGTAPFTYQWLRNGVAIQNASAATYQTPATALSDSGSRYSVQVSNATASVTSNQANLTVSPPSSANGLYLPFVHQVVGASLGYAAIPAAGGAATSVLPAGQGESDEAFLQGTVLNGMVSNLHIRSMLIWQSQRLWRQDLMASNGLPAPVMVSTLSPGVVCRGQNGSNFDSTLVAVGHDVADAARSWRIFSKAGADGACGTEDDTFVAVRMNMAPTDAPLSVARPVATLHGSDGTLTGWLLRQGQQIQRASADFSNPVTLFTLPAADLALEDGGNGLTNVWTFVSGNKVYALDLGSAMVAAPVALADLGAAEYLADVLYPDAQSLIVAISSANATRLVRHTLASRTSSALGAFPAVAQSLLLTPTRIVMSDGSGTLRALPLAGGQVQTFYTPAARALVLPAMQGDERSWLQLGDSVVSVNSDGSGVQTLPAARIAGCVYRQSALLTSSIMACDAMIVLQGSTVRAYDAASGVLRISYGDIALPSAPMQGVLSFASVGQWGQGAVLTQFLYNGNQPTQTGVASYYVKTDQAGIAPIALP